MEEGYARNRSRPKGNSMSDTPIKGAPMPYDTYRAYVRCANCDSYNDVEIPRGNLIKDFPCPKCGCKSLWRSI